MLLDRLASICALRTFADDILIFAFSRHEVKVEVKLACPKAGLFGAQTVFVHVKIEEQMLSAKCENTEGKKMTRVDQSHLMVEIQCCIVSEAKPLFI